MKRSRFGGGGGEKGAAASSRVFSSRPIGRGPDDGKPPLLYPGVWLVTKTGHKGSSASQGGKDDVILGGDGPSHSRSRGSVLFSVRETSSPCERIVLVPRGSAGVRRQLTPGREEENRPSSSLSAGGQVIRYRHACVQGERGPVSD